MLIYPKVFSTLFQSFSIVKLQIKIPEIKWQPKILEDCFYLLAAVTILWNANKVDLQMLY